MRLEDAQSSKPRDKHTIEQSIAAFPGSFPEVNLMVEDAMQEALLQQMHINADAAFNSTDVRAILCGLVVRYGSFKAQNMLTIRGAGNCNATILHIMARERPTPCNEINFAELLSLLDDVPAALAMETETDHLVVDFFIEAMREKKGERVDICDAAKKADFQLHQGSAVVIHGLLGADHLNGQTCVCKHWESGTGRWQVLLRCAEVKSVRPQNLVLAKDFLLRPGRTAMTRGLTDPSLNGLTCNCQQFDLARGRWHVVFPGGDVKALRPKNLERTLQSVCDDASREY